MAAPNFVHRGFQIMAAKFTLSAAHIATLTAISTALAANTAYHVSQADGADLVKNGFIEINPEMKDEAGNPAARLTDTGRAAVPADEAPANTTPATTSPALSAVSFVISTAAVLPDIKRGGGNTKPRESKYPLKDIPLGGALFLAYPGISADDAKKLSKQFGSTVATFNKDNTDKYLTSRTIEDGKAAGFEGRNEDGTPNPDAYAGVAGIAIYHRQLSEKKVRNVKPKAAPAAEGENAGENGAAA